MTKNKNSVIGGDYCNSPLAPQLLPVLGQKLTPGERHSLWMLFQAIGYCWNTPNKYHPDSSTLKSSWLEFIEAKTNSDPSYIAEYSNAVLVIDELKEINGEEAYEILFLEYKIPEIDIGTNPNKPRMMPLITTRIAHTKKFVIDEFIRVAITAGGFKSFGGKNYKGYIGGSRFTLRPRVRAFIPEGTAK